MDVPPVGIHRSMGIEDRLRALTRLLRDEQAFDEHMAGLARIEGKMGNVKTVTAAIVAGIESASMISNTGRHTEVERALEIGRRLRESAATACKTVGGGDQVDTLLRAVQFTDDLDLAGLRAYCVGLNHGAGGKGDGRHGPLIWNIYSRADDDGDVARCELVEALMCLRAGIGGAKAPGDMSVLFREQAA